MTQHLSPQDAERLLGGHAAGILTDEERGALFNAALEHQAVFDALMDEEALRELLADPAARTRLLAVLSEVPPAKPRPFWRGHPALLGLAASLLLALTASLVYLRNPDIRPKALPSVRPPETQPSEAQPMETSAQEPTKADAAPKPMAPPPSALRQRKTVPDTAPQLSGASAAPTPAQPAPPRPAKQEGAKEAPSPASREERKVEIEDRAKEVKGSLGGSVTANTAPAQTFQAAKKKAALPIWRIEGRSLTVQHPEGHWVGLLRRAPGAPVLLSGQLLAPGLTRIELGAEAGPWDLYVLPLPPEAPLHLTAEGPVAGFRVRIPDPGR